MNATRRPSTRVRKPTDPTVCPGSGTTVNGWPPYQVVRYSGSVPVTGTDSVIVKRSSRTL